MTLDEIIKEFENVQANYLYCDFEDKNMLSKFSDDFTKIYHKLNKVASEIYGERTAHDDKACTAFKARIAIDINTREKSWSKCLELSAASDEYAQFLEERIFYYRSWDSVSHLRDTIKQYLINIGIRNSNQ